MPRIITLTPNPTYDFAVDADFVEPNRKLRCHNPQSHPGGGGVNVSRAVARLGGETLAIITTGGPYGDAVTEMLKEEKVPVRSIPVKADTRIAFHVRDLGGDQEYRFNLPGAQMDASEVAALIAAVKAEAGEGDFVVGSGSLPAAKPADFWARAAGAAKSKGARFVLDSINGVREALDEGVYFLRLNKFEYPDLAGRELEWPHEVTSFAQKIVRSGGAEKVAVTQGGDGTIIASAEGVSSTPVIPVKAESAVGAGDSFVAATLVSMLRGASDEDSIRYGMAAAAATRLTAGTSLFRVEDVDALYKTGAAAPSRQRADKS
ncbi:MAG: hexose kinase [Pseudomonadota bacterium]